VNSGGWWIQPDWSQAREGWFFGLLIATVVITALLSPQRRRRLGLPKFLAAQTALTAVPLAGLFLIRSAQRHAFVEAGHGWWSAMWLSLLWMTIFIVVAQMVVRTLPPTRWWLRDLKRADKEIWKGRLQRWLGLARRG
jgi:hypothetical protein